MATTEESGTVKFPDFSLRGRVALVTGGSKGIGRAIALTFAHAGANVAVCSRHLDDAEKVASEIRQMGRRSLAVKTDTSLKAEVDSMVDRVVREMGTLDILVNNASVDLRKYVTETSEEEWDRIMNTNLRGYFLCAKAAARVMVPKKKGGIINMASGAAKRVLASTGVYSVSKAAIVALTECLAEELIQHNIRVNAIGPGATATEMNRIIWGDPQKLEAYLPRLWFKRFARVDEVCGVALLLASDASSYMAGQTVYLANNPIVR